MPSTRPLPPTDILRRASHARVSAIAGGALWLVVTAVTLPRPAAGDWPVALLDLAALVVVPLVLALVRPGADGAGARAWSAAVRLQPVAAVLLALTSRIDAGAGAVLAALPWAAVTALAALYGAMRAWARRGGPAWALSVDAGLAFLAIGGAWTLLHRAGMQPIGFSPVIVLLTAVHFHYAGLALPVAAGLAGGVLRDGVSGAAAWGVIAGVPLTAVGITATQRALPPWIETAAVVVTVLGGWLAALLHLRLAARRGHPSLARALWGVAGIALAAGMALALLYGIRPYATIRWITIPWMQAVHGSLNAFGFALAALAGWTVHDREGR